MSDAPTRLPAEPSRHWHRRYVDGRPYRWARGRYAPKQGVRDDLAVHPWVIWLPKEKPTAVEFLRAVRREMRIRFYQPRTIRSYTWALAGFLRWLNAPPDVATREDVRDYLELLVDGNASASWVSVNLSAIRTTFDKMCGGDLTLGLQTPRRPRRLPIILSTTEIIRLLKAAPSLRDKLLIGMMYATGVRVSEVVRLRWNDIDFDRRSVRIWQGKGRRDRDVILPESFRPLLGELAKAAPPRAFLFPAHDPARHVCPRTVQRALARALAIAGIAKHVTPHGLRHACATHMIEHGTDIRFIQKLLGHERLQTTTLYTRIAALPTARVQSPIDVITRSPPSNALPATIPAKVNLLEAGAAAKSDRIHMRFEVKLTGEKIAGTRTAEASVLVTNANPVIKLAGIRLVEVRPGWVNIEIPPSETWDEALRWLSPTKRERLSEPAFFRLLQDQLSHRFLKLIETCHPRSSNP